MLTKEDIIRYLKILDNRLKEKDLKGEILIFGGSAMVLLFNARPSTEDIDAIFKPKDKIYEIAKEISKEYKLSENWLNDSVKGFIESSEFEQKVLYRFDNLAVYVPEPEYLLAMKCMSLRIGAESSDIEDIKTIIKYLKLKKPEDVFKIIEKYYPENKILPKTYYFIKEIFNS